MGNGRGTESTNHLPARAALSGFGLFLLGGFFFFGWILHPNPVQPVRYNHSKHIENGLECLDCHVGARDQVRATLPGIDTCMLCHSEPVSESPETEKIRTAAAAGQELDWIQVTRVPAHVYFSHRRHVGLGGLECAECHGPMETLTRPPRRPFRAMNMDACISCHEQREVRHDCNDCHR